LPGNKDDNESEDRSISEPPTPKLDEEEIRVNSPDLGVRNNAPVRSYYNDTDTQKVNQTNDSLAKKPFKGIVTRTFTPSNDHEERCWKIALELGDPYMDYILKKLKEFGIGTINDAWESYNQMRNENERTGKPTRKPAALFNWCLKTLVDGEQALKEAREFYGDDSIGRD
jgi:hypothetical protein